MASFIGLQAKILTSSKIFFQLLKKFYATLNILLVLLYLILFNVILMLDLHFGGVKTTTQLKVV